MRSCCAIRRLATGRPRLCRDPSSRRRLSRCSPSGGDLAARGVFARSTLRRVGDSWPRTIVVGYDGTQPAERALARSVELARVFGGQVIVTDVAAPMPVQEPPVAGAFGMQPYFFYDPAQERRVDELLWQRHRDQIATVFADSGVTHEFAGVVGQPAAEILEVADRYDADLIVVGTREAGFFERLLGGSVSEGVARRAHRDVLIVH